MGGNASRLRADKVEMLDLLMLKHLHEGPLLEIASHLDIQSLSRLARTSIYFARFFKNGLEMAKRITHVLRGQETAILAMLEQSPDLLLAKGRSVDYSGRTYYNTPFQAAFLSHDVILCEKMEPLFDKLSDGKAKLAEQIHELFPNGMPEQTAYDLTRITQVINDSSVADIKAIFQKKKENTPIYREITSFREQFTALSLEEKFFNPKHLINAYSIYEKHENSWASPRCQAFWSLVIGYMQRFLPAFHAQVYCHGLSNAGLKEKNFMQEKNFKRSLQLISGSIMFPVAGDSGLGFDFGIYSASTRGRACRTRSGGGGDRAWAAARDLRLLENLVEQISQTYLAWGVDSQTPERPSANITP